MPPEIQKSIVFLAEAQYIRDNRQNKLKQQPREEIQLYGKLTKAWGYGFIKIEQIPWRHYVNGKLVSLLDDEKSTLVFGYYRDLHYVKKLNWVSSKSLEDALQHVRERNRFLFSVDV